MNDFIVGNGITCRISCYQYVVIGIWIWPLSKMFLCRGTLQSSVGSLQCQCCFSMSFTGISMISFCQHLLCVFGFIYIPTKHWIQAQTSFCKARAQISTVSSLGVLGVWQNPLKSPGACLNRDLADQGWNALQSDILMLCFFSLQEVFSSVYHENRQHVSVPRSSLQNMAKVTKRGLSAL